MEVKNILAVRNDRFGEFLLNIPAFRALKQSFAPSKLTLTVNPYVYELAKCIESADEVIPWENRRHRFAEVLKFARVLKNKNIDLAVIFNPSQEFNMISFLAGIPMRLGYNRKWPFLLTHKMEDRKYLGKKHEIEYNLELVSLIGAKTEDKSLSLTVNDVIINNLWQVSGLRGADDLIALHPWTSDCIKQWPIENFVALGKKIAEELKKTILIIGGQDERDKSSTYFGHCGTPIINLTGKTTLVQLAALLKKSQLLISGDSGPVHLASCVGTPVAALFRNDLPGKGPLRWGPTSKGSLVIEKASLSDITVRDVFEKIKRML